MTYKDIMRVIPTVQAASLVKHNISKMKKKKKGVEYMAGLGTTNIIGTSLIQAEADLIS